MFDKNSDNNLNNIIAINEKKNFEYICKILIKMMKTFNINNNKTKAKISEKPKY